MELNIVDNIADAITRLRFLEQKTKNDSEMIELLRKQNETLTEDLSDAKHNFGVELYQAQQERDAAIKRADETKKKIEEIGKLALEGVRKSLGDERSGAKIQSAPISPDMDARLPKPVLAPR
jgi:hypothetical protein